MVIRKAILADAPAITPFILLAMEDIVYAFIGEWSSAKAAAFMGDLIRQPGNQYSYENCWVAVIDHEIVAVALVYDGGRLQELREPVARKVLADFNREFNPEDETQSGEFYIDSIAVSKHMQGRGIGSKLFNFLIDEYVNKRGETLGLLVDVQNPKAKKLYLNLGFRVVGKKTLVGKPMEHLQLG